MPGVFGLCDSPGSATCTVRQPRQTRPLSSTPASCPQAAKAAAAAADAAQQAETAAAEAEALAAAQASAVAEAEAAAATAEAEAAAETAEAEALAATAAACEEECPPPTAAGLPGDEGGAEGTAGCADEQGGPSEPTTPSGTRAERGGASMSDASPSASGVRAPLARLHCRVAGHSLALLACRTGVRAITSRQGLASRARLHSLAARRKPRQRVAIPARCSGCPLPTTTTSCRSSRSRHRSRRSS